MKRETALKLIERELVDLDVPKNSRAWEYVIKSTVDGYDVLTKKELVKLVELKVNDLPSTWF